MNENIIAKGIIFELVQMKQDDGRVFEKARRAPGVRTIICDEVNQTILLTKEYRQELGEWDYRLPGGKVFDALDDWTVFRDSGDDIVEAAKKQAIDEAQQEAGVEISELNLYKKSILGATVEWDLYIFETTAWQLNVHGQELGVGEKIEVDNWVNFAQAKRMILDGQMQEERVALVLLQWIEERK